MYKIRSFIILPLLLFATTAVVLAQAQSTYDQHQAFDPTFMNNPGTYYRSASGKPGPGYWQNRADYNIHVKLDEKDTTISGTTDITYTNNSPDELNYLWLQLDQNLFKPTSWGDEATPISGDRFGIKGFNGGDNIKSVKVTYEGKTYSAKYVISDTRMQVLLDRPLKAQGGQLKLDIKYSFRIPQFGSDRMGRLKTKNGWIYEIAQWYPRMEVYDDVKGWNTLPYLGLGEFYLDYGDFDYSVTVPAGMIVVGSGVLQNPKDVLTQEEIKRLDKARHSNKTVYIIKPDEVGKKDMRPKDKGDLTWRFRMKDTRDVSWAASRAFVWDAAKVNVPSGEPKIAMSAYPVEVDDNAAWGRSTEYLKRSIEIYSKLYHEFPWRSAVSVAGVVHGMEYPGMTFNGWQYKGSELWGVITHEIGHNWFPMLVGSNERRYMWMDEGLNTFINYYSTKDFNHGEYFRKTRLDARALAKNVLAHNTEPLMTPPAVINLNNYDLYYSKTAVGLHILRNFILGPKRFDRAFRTYIDRWAYKHPRPIDFFRTMNDAAGANLDWFWKGWFYKTWKVDQAVTGVSYVHDNPADGSYISIENMRKMPMPVEVKVYESNGHSGTMKLPVEIWQRGAKWEFKYHSTSRLDSVVIDPNHILPDINPSNNKWVRRDINQ